MGTLDYGLFNLNLINRYSLCTNIECVYIRDADTFLDADITNSIYVTL